MWPRGLRVGLKGEISGSPARGCLAGPPLGARRPPSEQRRRPREAKVSGLFTLRPAKCGNVSPRRLGSTHLAPIRLDSMTELDELMTVEAVAAYLQMNPQTIRNWVDAGRSKQFASALAAFGSAGPNSSGFWRPASPRSRQTSEPPNLRRRSETRRELPRVAMRESWRLRFGWRADANTAGVDGTPRPAHDSDLRGLCPERR